MNGDTIYFKSGEFGNFAVHIDGLSTLMKRLEEADPKLKRATVRGIKDSMGVVLSSARANARKIMDDGTYERSLSVASRRAGSSYVLKSDDVAAPVKEFAKFGAKTKSANGSKESIARLRKRSGVGVPRRAYAPRVMVPAVNDNTELVKTRVEEQLAKVLEEIHG